MDFSNEIACHDLIECNIKTDPDEEQELNGDECDENQSENLNGEENQSEVQPDLIKIGNSSSYMFQCSACGLTFKTLEKLEQHVFKDHAENKLVLYACEHCDFIAKTVQSSIHHKQKSHATFSCPFCDFFATTRNYLRSHISKHYGRKPSRYKIQKYNMIKTEECPSKVGDKPFMCVLCKQTFVKAKTLKKHELKAHTFQCGFCDRKLKNKRSFNAHVKIHTDDRPYKCGICDKTFITRNTCNAHEKRHSLDVQCQYCDFKGSKTKVTTHEATHLGKRYKCEECKFETWKYTILKKHEQVHKRFSKRKCERCDYVANTLSMRRKHEQAHCAICDFYSEDNKRLEAHRIEVHKFKK